MVEKIKEKFFSLEKVDGIDALVAMARFIEFASFAVFTFLFFKDGEVIRWAYNSSVLPHHLAVVLLFIPIVAFAGMILFAKNKSIRKADVIFDEEFMTEQIYTGKTIRASVNEVIIDGKNVMNEVNVLNSFDKCGEFYFIIEPKNNHKMKYISNQQITIKPQAVLGLAVSCIDGKATINIRMPNIKNGTCECIVQNTENNKIIKTFTVNNKDYIGETLVTKTIKLPKGNYSVSATIKSEAYSNETGKMKKAGSIKSAPVAKRFTIR